MLQQFPDWASFLKPEKLKNRQVRKLNVFLFPLIIDFLGAIPRACEQKPNKSAVEGNVGIARIKGRLGYGSLRLTRQNR